MSHCLDEPQFIWKILFSLWFHSALGAGISEARGVRIPWPSPGSVLPCCLSRGISKDTVVINNSSKSIKPLTAGVLLSFLAYKGQKFAAKELQQGLDAHEPFLNSSSISVISTLIKQSRRSQIYRLQNRGTDDTFQALGKPFGYMDVQTYLQVLYPLCFKISQILFK